MGEKLNNQCRVALALLTVLLAGCLIISNTVGSSAQNTNLDTQSPTTKLLQEFRTEKVFWRQAEVGEKLVALKDKRIAPAMLLLLKSESRAERCNAGRVLAGLGDDRGLFAVLAELKDKKPRPNRPMDCNSCQFPFSPAQIEQDRYYAAHVLRKIGDKRSVPALIELLQDKSLYYQAAIVLGHLGDKRAVPALLRSLKQAQIHSQIPSSPNTEMRYWAGYGLLLLKHPAGLPAVVEFLKPEHLEIQRRYAADALGEFGGKRAVPFLIQSLGDADIGVRVNAIMALGRIGDKTAVPALQELLNDTSEEKGNARIRYEGPMPFFQWMTVREAALEALKQIETKSRPQ